jgi:endonuclease/exonuclease/phosphatase family metal-dependent hydrolase
MRKQANAVLAKERPQRVLRRYFDRGMKRLALEVEYSTFQVLLVHLALKRECRTAQIAQLAQWTREAIKPCLVAGDFNTFAGDAELQPLHEAGLRNASTGQPSWPSWAPRHQIDYILHGPGIEVTAFRVPTVQLSDHYPLVCDFRVRGAPEGGKPTRNEP